MAGGITFNELVLVVFFVSWLALLLHSNQAGTQRGEWSNTTTFSVFTRSLCNTHPLRTADCACAVPVCSLGFLLPCQKLVRDLLFLHARCAGMQCFSGQLPTQSAAVLKKFVD